MVTNTTAAGTYMIDQNRFTVPDTRGGSDRLREVAQEFEAIFVKHMLDAMKNTLNEEDRIVKTGMAGDIFNDMLYDEYAKIMSKTAGLGLADMIVSRLES